MSSPVQFLLQLDIFRPNLLLPGKDRAFIKASRLGRTADWGPELV